MSSKFRTYFFIGKGGVGKTTCAASYAVKLAKEGIKTLIVSLDPAHNLGDVLDKSLTDTPVRVMDNLDAIEVDFEKMITKHLKELSAKIKDIYSYLRVLNLDKYIDVLKHSPGIEEYATLDKITEILRDNIERKKYDVIIFDTPPTGLTIRVMALPSVTLLWIGKLLELRLAILERRRVLERILGERAKVKIGDKVLELPSSITEDPIFKELTSIREEVELVNGILTDSKRSTVVMVVNPELLPMLEAKRAYEFLLRLKIPVKYLIINKLIEEESVPERFRVKVKEQRRSLELVDKYFRGLKLIKIPLMVKEPRGIDDLIKISEYLHID